MSSYNKRFYRAAQQIHAVLADRSRIEPRDLLPARQWESVRQLVHSIGLANRGGFRHAERRRKQELEDQLDRLNQSISSLTSQLETERNRLKPVPTPGELYRDLVALSEEFPAIEISEVKALLCVTTASIELEGVYLGPFEIRLDWRGLKYNATYQVLATNPHPAASNSEVVHPHVSHHRLCEGDGQRAIQSALESGRLHDFFSIVHQLLNTYGEGRAFVELDSWSGELCSDCGGMANADESYRCSGCEDPVCVDCSRYCRSCDQIHCWNCCGCCHCCDDATCNSCLETCNRCSSRMCRTCLTDNLCQECHETFEENSEEVEPANLAESKGALPAVLADGVGEVALPAGSRSD